MNQMNDFKQYLGDINDLFDSSFGENANTQSKEYIHPKLKNLGSVSLVLVREVIAPFVVRNFEEGITDIELGDQHETYVRAVPNKFKYPERGRGLQLLRAFKCGGTMPQNKTQPRDKKQKASEFYDLNTMVFGDSTVHDGRILPVKAGVNYSDAISILPKDLCVGETSHISAMESGTLYDDERQDSSVNLFSRHFVLPGTLMVQVLSTRGQVLPQVGLDHLLLCLGVAGTYGGQTSVTGTNIRTHLVGLYGDAFEQAQTSPYELLKTLPKEPQALTQNVEALTKHIHTQLSEVHQLKMDSSTITDYQHQLLKRFDDDFEGMKQDYQSAKGKLDDFFNGWFIKPEKKSTARKKAS